MTTTRGHEYLIIEKMCEHNPLQIASAPVPSSSGNQNTKGRPRKSQSITFSTQPQSIVSQLLQQMLTENKISLPIEWKSGTNTTPILPIVEDTDQYSTAIEEADQIKYENPQKEFSKRKTEMVPKVYLCDYSNCLYTTKLSSNLQKHKRTHTGEKPYLCDKCSFRTSFSNSLNVHKRLHTTERPYPCGHCNYRCNSISNLKKHNLIKHKDKKI